MTTSKTQEKTNTLTWRFHNNECIELWKGKVNPNSVGRECDKLLQFEEDVKTFLSTIDEKRENLVVGDWGSFEDRGYFTR